MRISPVLFLLTVGVALALRAEVRCGVRPWGCGWGDLEDQGPRKFPAWPPGGARLPQTPLVSCRLEPGVAGGALAWTPGPGEPRGGVPGRLGHARPAPKGAPTPARAGPSPDAPGVTLAAQLRDSERRRPRDPDTQAHHPAAPTPTRGALPGTRRCRGHIGSLQVSTEQLGGVLRVTWHPGAISEQPQSSPPRPCLLRGLDEPLVTQRQHRGQHGAPPTGGHTGAEGPAAHRGPGKPLDSHPLQQAGTDLRHQVTDTQHLPSGTPTSPPDHPEGHWRGFSLLSGRRSVLSIHRPTLGTRSGKIPAVSSLVAFMPASVSQALPEEGTQQLAPAPLCHPRPSQGPKASASPYRPSRPQFPSLWLTRTHPLTALPSRPPGLEAGSELVAASDQTGEALGVQMAPW